MLDATYHACIRFADLLMRRRPLTLLVGLPLLLAVILVINRLLLHDFPNSSDEYVYLYQAATMAAGRLWNDSPAAPEAFWFTYIEQQAGRGYGTFPFGWPAVLTLAMHLRVPVWLVNPLLGCATAMLAGTLGRRLYGPRAGVWAALVVGSMPFVLFNAASYFSHTFSGVLLLAAACLAARQERAPRHAFAVGFLVAWAVLTRYYTGVLCGAPIVLLLMRRPAGMPDHMYRRFVTRMLLFVALGGVPGIVALGTYDWAINGSPWQLTTQAGTFGNWFKPGFAWHGPEILASHIGRHLVWAPPAIVLLYVMYLWTTPRVRRTPLDWTLAVTALTLVFYFERGGNQYGARFHYEAFLFATIFVCGQVFRRESLVGAPRRDRRAFAAFALSLMALPVQFTGHAVIEERVIRERLDPFTSVTQAGVHDAVVFMEGRIGTARPMYGRDLTRNGLTYDGSVLYAIDAGLAADCAVMLHYPGRAAYHYVWDVTNRTGMLTRFSCGG